MPNSCRSLTRCRPSSAESGDRADALLADRGYDHGKYRRLPWQRGIRPVIAKRPTSRHRADNNAKAAVELKLRRAQEERQHTLWVARLYVGAVISIVMLGGGIYIARGVWWLPTCCAAPAC
jgi:transposase